MEKTTLVLLDLDGTVLARWTDNDNPDWSPRVIVSREALRAIGYPVAICSNQGGVAWNLAGGRPGKTYPDFPTVLERLKVGLEATGAMTAIISLFHPEAMPLIQKKPLPEVLANAERCGVPKALAEAAFSDEPLVFFLPIERKAGMTGQEFVACPLRIAHKVGGGPWPRWVAASWDESWRKPNPGMLYFARIWARRRLGEFHPWVYIGDEDDDREAAERAMMAFIHAGKIRAQAHSADNPDG